MVTACGRNFPSYGSRVEGEPAAEDICEMCPPAETHAAREDYPAQMAAVVRVPRRRRHTRHGLATTFVVALLTVVALAVFVYLTWPR